jgi:hypothetical protein
MTQSLTGLFITGLVLYHSFDHRGLNYWLVTSVKIKQTDIIAVVFHVFTI